MSNLKKTLNLPEQYDAVQMKRILEQLIDGTQSRYYETVSKAPNEKDGNNGETRIDPTTGKLYIKMAGIWKSFSAE